jgi:hypothetical protein
VAADRVLALAWGIRALMVEIQDQLFPVPQERSTSDDYLTPPQIFEALALEFDLDVASPPGGVQWVPAKRFLTKAEDGLSQPWEGRVWMNPPYTQVTAWAGRFTAHAHGIALLPHGKSAWHNRLWADAEAVAVPFKYFDFVGGSIPYPVWFAAYGPECVEALGRVGIVRFRG